MILVLDASALIALLDAADGHHDAAGGILADWAETGGGLTIHRITLAECLVAPARQGRAREAAAAIASSGILMADADADEPLRLARLRAGTGLRMPDCCVADLAIGLDAPLMTFDARLASRAAALGIRIIPADPA